MIQDLQRHYAHRNTEVQEVASHRQIQLYAFLHLQFSQKKIPVAHIQMDYPEERQETSTMKSFNRPVLTENWKFD